MNTGEMRECIERCTECEKICIETAAYCAEKGGKHAMPKHLRLLAECAQMCGTAAKFMLLGSPNHVLTCGVAAEVAMQCAEECEEFPEDDRMKACADACRRCEAECTRMAEMETVS